MFDVLYIDQSNSVEKATQVLLMRNVYAAVKKVVVWLENVTLNSEEAIDFIHLSYIVISKLVQEGKAINRHILT